MEQCNGRQRKLCTQCIVSEILNRHLIEPSDSL
jgi:hypothetical protein